MDITTLQLPARTERRGSTIPFLFADSSINICYDTAIADVAPSVSTTDSTAASTTSVSTSITDDTGDVDVHSSSSSTPTRAKLTANRSRSGSTLSEAEYNYDFIGDIVDAEVTNFVKSLQEPKYAKALSGTEISWLFQEFYRQLRAKLEAQLQEPTDATQSGLAMLSRDELVARKRRRQRQVRCVEHALDLAESELTSEFYDRLLDYGDDPSADRDFDRRLQQKIDAIRNHDELKLKLRNALGITESLEEKLRSPPSTSRESSVSNTPANSGTTTPGAAAQGPSAVDSISDIAKERTPQGKLTVLVKSHQAVVSALDAEGGETGADMILPAFVSAVVGSSLTHLWRTIVFVRRFRRSECLVSHNAYCLTNFDATLQFLEAITFDEVPEGVDQTLFSSALSRARSRSSSQSSRISNTSRVGGPLGILGSFGVNYRNIFSRLAAAPELEQREGITAPPHPQTVPHTQPAPSSRAGSPSSRTSGSGSGSGSGPRLSRSASQPVVAIRDTTDSANDDGPPICEKFLSGDVGSLRIDDVQNLLTEYRKLAKYAKDHHH